MATTDRTLKKSRAIEIEDLRHAAQRRLPKPLFDFLDGGAEAETTLAANCRAFLDVTFRPRGAVAFDTCRLNTQVLGHDLSLPAILAPVGCSRLLHPGGEVCAAQAAGEAGTGYVLSTISGYTLENVRAASQGPVWYQLYLLGGREVAECTLERARHAGFSALVATVDTPVAGLRMRDLRNGIKELLGTSLLAKLPYLPDILAHPDWLLAYLRDGGRHKLQNVVLPGKGPMDLLDVGSTLSKAVVTWEDLRWIRKVWSGPIVLKGLLRGDDARRAVDEGAAGIIVSNHGGRQLDSAPATLRVLPEIIEAVQGQAEVLMDGGIRCGSDIVKAICLGARAVLIGRAYAYGLAAAGQAGVAQAIDILRSDIERTIRLLGCPSVAALDRSYINLPRSW